MDRDIDPSPQEPSRARGAGGSRPAQDHPSERPRRVTPEPTKSERLDPKEPERDTHGASRQRESIGRDWPCRVSPAEQATLRQIGRFRTVAVEDLTRFHYRGDPARLRQDLRSLTSQGLAQRRTVSPGGKRGPIAVVVLTRRGKELLERLGP